MISDCASLEADLFWFSYEKNGCCLYVNNQDGLIGAFNSTARYLDG